MRDKRILKRQYLQAKSRAGVYAIRNRVTGRVLVASSTDVQGMLNRHRFELRLGQHRNRTLALDWALHGEESFLFEVLDWAEPRDEPGFSMSAELALLENLWRQEIFLAGQDNYADDAGTGNA